MGKIKSFFEFSNTSYLISCFILNDMGTAMSFSVLGPCKGFILTLMLLLFLHTSFLDVPEIHKAWSHLSTFVRALSSAWKTLHSHSHMAGPLHSSLSSGELSRDLS